MSDEILMELLLNIFAVATILVLLIMWRARWVHQPGRADRNASRECLSICCVAMLAFFAISMTDDLQGDLMIMDKCSSSRSQSVVASSANTSRVPPER